MKNFGYIVLILLLLNLLKQKEKQNPKKVDASIKDVLLNAGFPKDTINLFVAQVTHETGGKINSTLEVLNHNISGIKFLNKPYQKNATQGVKSPEGNYYAAFPSYEDWAKDYKRILSLGKEKPINAKTPKELVDRLFKNGYFTDGYNNYLAGVQKAFSKTT